jgi:hypothetical protein
VHHPLTRSNPIVNNTKRQSNRHRVAPRRYGYDGSQGFGYTAEVLKQQQDNMTSLVGTYIATIQHSSDTAAYLSSVYANIEEGSIEYPDPFVYAQLRNNKSSDPDTFKYYEAIYLDDWP